MFQRLFPLFLIFFSYTYVFSAEENFLLINGNTNEIIIEIGPHVDERISPCSTFKITLSLMGYDSNILKDENNPIWDFQEGYDDWLENWRKAQSPQTWMKHSCVWYSKILALHIGSEKMKNYLNSFQYGNQDLSGGVGQPGKAGVLWINSSLKISTREQVEFINKMISQQLSISLHALRMTKNILFKEELPGKWKLYGKTGGGSDISVDGKILEHAWFVGWIEKDNRTFPFAYLIRDNKINPNQRIPRVKELILTTGIQKM